MRIFITGGTGFFGKALLRYWQIKNPKFEKIYLLSRSPEAFLKKYSSLVEMLPIEFIKGDILDLTSTRFKVKFDVLLHAATDSTTGPSMERLEVYRQITQGTEEVLKFAVNHKCQKFILTSSGGVYGPQPDNMERIPEDYLGMPDPLDPKNAYGIGKRAAEHLTALYAEKYDFDYIIARCFAFIGEDLPLDKHFAIGNFINDVVNDRNIKINGTGLTIRSYMYQEDLAIQLTYLIQNQIDTKVLNIGSDEEINLYDLARMVIRISNKSLKIDVMGSDKNESRNRYIPDISKCEKYFKKNEKVSLACAIEKTISLLERNRVKNG